MTVTMKTIPAIISALKKRKPSTLTKDSDKPLSSQQAVKQLAPTLLAKRREGIPTAELVDFLAEYGIAIKAHNLTRSLRKYSIGNGIQKSDKKNETSSDPSSTTTDEAVN